MGMIGGAVASVPGVVIVETMPERRRREMLSSQLSGGIASNAGRRQMIVIGESFGAGVAAATGAWVVVARLGPGRRLAKL